MGAESDVEVADGEIPEETAGPYPGDGSNGPNVLSESGVVRSDITSSFGSASGVAEGVPLTLRFRVYDLAGEDVTPLAGAALYAWHCDREGNYSMYDGDAVDENYLRGVQEADAGRVAGVHDDLPCLLRRALAARPLRDLRVPRQRHQRVDEAAHLPAGVPPGRVRRGLRDRRLRAVRRQPGPGQPGLRRHLQRRLLAADGQASPARSPTGTSPPSTSRCDALTGWGGALPAARR